MSDETRATFAVPMVVLVAALPAFLPPVDLRGVHVDRVVQMAASTALGFWIARGRPWTGLGVLGAMTACLWAIALPRGPQWPSYSYADAALVIAVGLALYQLQAAQRRPVLAVSVALALTLWLCDGLLMAPWCGALIGWRFTSTTACGSAWGDPIASIPVLLTMAAWLTWLRSRQAGN
jgi:hypothetical protein